MSDKIKNFSLTNATHALANNRLAQLSAAVVVFLALVLLLLSRSSSSSIDSSSQELALSPEFEAARREHKLRNAEMLKHANGGEELDAVDPAAVFTSHSRHDPPAHAMPLGTDAEFHESVQALGSDPSPEVPPSSFQQHVFPVRPTPLQSHDERYRGKIMYLPVQVWQYNSFCGGARLTNRAQAAMNYGAPASYKRLYISHGDHYDDAEPIHMSLLTDADGMLLVPYIPSSIATLKAPKHNLNSAEDDRPDGSDGASDADEASVGMYDNKPLYPNLLAALPSNSPSARYCLTDLSTMRKEKKMVSLHKHHGGDPKQYHIIDYGCMDQKWARCLYVIDLTHPEKLTLSQPKQRFHGKNDIKKRLKGEETNLIRTKPVTTISLHHPCQGRGECEEWRGPLPK